MTTWHGEGGYSLQNTLIVNSVKTQIDKDDLEICLEEQRELNSWHNLEKEGRRTYLRVNLRLTEAQ